MDEILEKSLRNGLIVGCVFFFIAFLYGGIYNEMIIEGMGITIANILWALFGSVFGGLYALVPVFILSLLVYYIIDKVKGK